MAQSLLLYWQAPTILNTHLSSSIKDFHAGRLVYEPLASFDKDGVLIQNFSVLVNKKARFVKMMAYTTGKCPEWHVGSGYEAWLFVDEIAIE